MVTAHDGLEAVEKAFAEAPSLVILDVTMPRLNGYEACRLLKHEPATRSLPVVILTTKDQPRDRFWGLETGADYYLTKDAEPQRIAELVQNMVSGEPSRPKHPSTAGTTADVMARGNDLPRPQALPRPRSSPRRRARDGASPSTRRSRGDGPRRPRDRPHALRLRFRRSSELEVVLRSECERAARYEEGLSVLLVGIDGLAEIAAAHGTVAADAVRRETARLLTELLRRMDVVARYGKDELLAVLPHTVLDEAGKIAERVRAQVKARAFRSGARELKATASIGFAGYPGPSSSEDLLRAAEEALQRAREGGGNRVKGRRVQA